MVILTHKTDTLITPTTFLKKCEKCKHGLHWGTEGVDINTKTKTIWENKWTNYHKSYLKMIVQILVVCTPIWVREFILIDSQTKAIV